MSTSLGCWCGALESAPTRHPAYRECLSCGTARTVGAPVDLGLSARDSGLYGRSYWYEHMAALGYPTLPDRARADLPERCQYWLRDFLRFRLPPGRVVELGCAHGAFLKLLEMCGFSVRGFEMSPAVVAFARAAFGVDVCLGPLNEDCAKAGAAEAVCLFDVLEHVPDPVATLRLLRRMLTVGGILVVQTPSFESAVPVDWPHFKPDEHLFLFSRASLSGLLREASFSHVTWRPALFPGDQFVFASTQPLLEHARSERDHALLATPNGRLVLSMQDMYETLSGHHPSAESVGESNRTLSALRALAWRLPRPVRERVRRIGRSWLTRRRRD